MSQKISLISWRLGHYLDGWADLIEGIGSKAESVRKGTLKSLSERNMPDIQIEDAEIKEGYLSDETRDYSITATSPGARTTIYIEKHGNDLFTSWRSFILPVPNWRLIGYYALAALMLSVISYILISGFQFISRVRQIIKMYEWSNFSSAFWNWILFAALITFGVVLIMGVVGLIRKKGFSAFLSCGLILLIVFIALLISLFIKDSGEILKDEVARIFELGKLVFSSGNLPLWSIFGIFIYTFFGILFLAMILGYILRRNLLAFILKEPSLFDTEDITAMNLSVHKSILRALDQEGIDPSKLRLKREFKSGRRGDTI